MNHSTETQEIDAAIVLMQSELEPAKMDSVNPHFKSKYADLAACKSAARAPMAKAGLGVIQTIGSDLDGGKVSITTRLIHKSGQFYEYDMSLFPKSMSPQDIGSALTYLRRYTFSAIIGISAEEDDDGNDATRGTSSRMREIEQRVTGGLVSGAPFNMDGTDDEMWFGDEMRKLKIPDDKWLDIARALHGKTKDALPRAVNHIMHQAKR